MRRISVIFIVVIPALVALWLLGWSCARMVQEVKARKRLSLKYCLACGLGLMILTALFCLALEVMAALGHSEVAKSQAKVVSLLSFVLVVVLPTVGLLLYRRLQPASAETDSSAEGGETRQGLRHAMTEALADRTVIERLKRLGIAGLACGCAMALILGGWFGAGPLLTYAATHGNTSLAMLLVDAGVNVDRIDDRGMTPLMHAAAQGNAEMARILLDKGAAVNFSLGNSPPLFYAIEGRKEEVIDLLLIRGAQVNYVERYGATPLIHAGQYGSAQAVEVLLKHGADMKARDATGRTALMRAVLCNRFEVVEALVKRGADLTMRDQDGNTALGLRWHGNSPRPDDRIVDLLVTYGATR
jgi:hypothetical protein